MVQNKAIKHHLFLQITLIFDHLQNKWLVQ